MTTDESFLELAGNAPTPFSTFIIADLDSEDGMAFVKEALESLVSAISRVHSDAYPFPRMKRRRCA